VPIVARIPFSRRIAEVYARGGLVTDELSEIAHSVAGLVETMRDLAVAGVVAR
jgi:MinD superfamily P-loop ATPase